MGTYPEMEAIVRALIRSECPVWSPNLDVAILFVLIALLAAFVVGCAMGRK